MFTGIITATTEIVKLDLRKTSVLPGVVLVESRPFLSGRGVAVATPMSEKAVLADQNLPGEPGILRKSSKTTNQDGGLELTLKTPKGWDDIAIGESIATNGVCLTVTSITNGEYTVFLMPETLNLTSFGGKLPKKLNLERALKIGERLSGHIVQGHVDGVGTVSSIDQTDGYRIYINFAQKFRPLLIQKGSITIDGVSLTIATLTDDIFSVAIIPHTLQHTTLGSLKPGDKVNLEFDIIGKYAINLNKDTPYAKS